MGHTQAQKAENRERIVAATARRIREQGLERPAIAELMREVGLTHGGFYKQFGSRDELMGEAVERVMAETRTRMEGVVDGTDDPLAAVARAYVSAEHRDDVGGGCGLPALSAEVTHADTRARDAYRAQVEAYVAGLATLDDTSRDLAMVRVSAMVGAILISRALQGTPESDAFLDAVQDAFVSSDGVLRGTAPDGTRVG
ncbi:TetR/AcrR family transcriptional regulator [Patulibacter minatonensis]|uniref:TetR/AcrR family transcriptional regulator n=1 Tax=Patulibacter minatonensis TaxID=298163 RepID=UPI00055EAAD1|nr:TetR/AcrR family transcriptional regulator [Patulibacter minatonensis]